MTGAQPAQQSFQHVASDEAACSCPIHRNRDGDPFTAPLGWRFADAVTVDAITREQAADLYAAHHGYMADVPTTNLAHHGLRYQGELTGAITWRYPLLGRKRVHLDGEGRPVPEPRTAEQVRAALPDRLHATALDVLDLARADGSDVVDAPVLTGDRFVEAARICLGVRMANLASASLARSQERFVLGPKCDGAVEYLLTFVRADYDAAMVRALRDKGWTCVGWTRPSQAGNRENREIREHRKWVFLCPVETVQEQADLGRWSR